MKHRILIVDDETDILEFVSYNLQREGYEVYTATNGVEALQLAKQHSPHIILLDRLMPQMDGVTACRLLRQEPTLSNAMIVFLSALGEEEQQVEGYDAGADDYITKPIRMKALMSRIAAISKRIQLIDEPSFSVDFEQHSVVVNGEHIVLPRKEFDLLSLLYSKSGKLFTREEIYSKVWGSEVVVGDRTIDVHVRKLRSKIGDEKIITVKGIGYKFL